MYLPHELAPVVTVESEDGSITLCRQLRMSYGSGMVVSEEIARAIIFLADEFEVGVDDLAQSVSDLSDAAELMRSIERDEHRLQGVRTDVYA